MRNYKGANPSAIDDPIVRESVAAIDNYLRQVQYMIGAKGGGQTTNLSGAKAAYWASQKLTGWDTAETLILSGKIAANPTTTTGDMIYRNADGNLDRLGVTGEGSVLKVTNGLPQWATQLNTGGRVFYPPEVFHGHAIGVNGTSPDICQRITMSQSTKTAFTTTIAPPPNFSSGHFVVYYAGGTTGDDIVINLYVLGMSLGAAVIDQAYSVTDKLVCTTDANGYIMVSPNSVNCQDALATGDLVRIVVERDPTDADDTNPDAIEFIGLELVYSAPI